MIRLIGLDDNRGGVEVAAADATDDLSEELERALFGGEIGEGEAGIGLNDADGGEMRQIEPASKGLGADEDVNIADFNIIIEGGEVFRFFIIPVKTGDFGLWEEPRELGFEELGAKALVNYAGVVAFWAARRHLFRVDAEVAAQSIVVGVEGEGEITIRAEGLPTAIFADSHRGRTTTIMKNKGLMFIFNIILYFCQEEVGKIAIFGEIGAILEVDDSNFRINSGGFGSLGKFNQ